MKKLTLLYILLALLILPSCGHSDSRSLKVAGSFSVPGMYCSDLKGMESSVEVLETDSEGRTLFYYTTDNVITGNRETAIVICQKYNSRYVYFYENRCYIVSGYENSDIEALKQENDWDMPLNEDKMSRRKYSITFDGFIHTESELSYSRVYKECGKALGVSESQITDGCMIDMDIKGNNLVWLCVNEEKTYIALIKTSYEVSFFEIEENMDISTTLAEFKQNNGWVYGY